MDYRIKSKLIKIPYLGKKYFWNKIIAEENGMKESKFLRHYIKEKYHVEVGMYSYGGCFSTDFNLGGKVRIGRYCSFASNIHYFGANHPMHFGSTSPYFYSKSFGYDVQDVERKELDIGNDVWCGYNVTITNGCSKIGNGSVIAAGAVVTKDVPPYAIVGGNPAKEIKYRFDDDTINLLEKSRWWEKTPDQLLKYYTLISNPLMWAEALISDSDIR
ncbi:MAG: CatB-related O-acetyltransferase [Lachnospiraceae bacterium]|nr:CatB-related O-acetyltransferase [Lachnospiraceae bacterium]